MTDWSYLLFASSIYALGFLGLFGVSLLPLRAFIALRRNAFLWHSSVLGKTSLILVGAAAIAAIAIGIPQIAGVFRCLTEMHCGGNRASGWFFLAIFGACYLAFELVSAIVLAIARKVGRVATQQFIQAEPASRIGLIPELGPKEKLPHVESR